MINNVCPHKEAIEWANLRDIEVAINNTDPIDEYLFVKLNNKELEFMSV